MKTMNISLPAEMRAFIEQQVAQGRFGTASEYIRALIRQEQLRQAEEELDQKLLEGLNSGKGRVFTKEVMEEILEKARKRTKTKEAA